MKAQIPKSVTTCLTNLTNSQNYIFKGLAVLKFGKEYYTNYFQILIIQFILLNYIHCEPCIMLQNSRVHNNKAPQYTQQEIIEPRLVRVRLTIKLTNSKHSTSFVFSKQMTWQCQQMITNKQTNKRVLGRTGKAGQSDVNDGHEGRESVNKTSSSVHVNCSSDVTNTQVTLRGPSGCDNGITIAEWIESEWYPIITIPSDGSLSSFHCYCTHKNYLLLLVKNYKRLVL